MANIIGLKNLCLPAKTYFILSFIAIFVIGMQNLNNSDMYCLGMYSCNTSNIVLFFIFKILYVIFWTWVLNIICRGGAPGVAWFLVLIQYILFFVLLGLLMVT
jgi:hypothetical protein